MQSMARGAAFTSVTYGIWLVGVQESSSSPPLVALFGQRQLGSPLRWRLLSVAVSSFRARLGAPDETKVAALRLLPVQVQVVASSAVISWTRRWSHNASLQVARAVGVEAVESCWGAPQRRFQRCV